jgi:hypothetical protein
MADDVDIVSGSRALVGPVESDCEFPRSASLVLVFLPATYILAVVHLFSRHTQPDHWLPCAYIKNLRASPPFSNPWTAGYNVAIAILVYYQSVRLSNHVYCTPASHSSRAGTNT